MLTLYGACAVTFMMVMYAFESRDRIFVLLFAFGCALSSSYGFLAGTWPFGVVEAIWAGIAVNRYRVLRQEPAPEPHIACTLTAGELEERSRVGQALAERTLIGSPVATKDGIQLRFRGDAENDLRAIIKAEAECCPFLDFRLHPGADPGPRRARPRSCQAADAFALRP